MNLTYTIELKDWDNMDSYPTLYKGNNLIIAMMHFKESHLKGEDVVLFIEDEEGNELDTITNYNNERNNVIHCNDFFTPTDSELKKQYNEAITQKYIYNDMYKDELNKNEELKKVNERLQADNRQLRQQLNKVNDTKENTIHWYAYRLRGFSPFCQPKGHIEHDSTIGRHGIIAYNRQLTENELEEYELLPYNRAV
jgi:hypothetical protein